MTARRIHATEAQEQTAVIDWWQAYARTKGVDARLLHAVPNGAHLAGTPKQRAIQMRKLKRTGLVVGYPDLALDLPMASEFYGGSVFCGMRIEMKAKGGRESVEQRSMIELLRGTGFNVIVAYGAEEAIRAIKAYVERAL